MIAVEDMIKEVDVDGDGRIDFYGKLSFNSEKGQQKMSCYVEFVHALGEPGEDDDDEDDDLGYNHDL